MTGKNKLTCDLDLLPFELTSKLVHELNIRPSLYNDNLLVNFGLPRHFLFRVGYKHRTDKETDG